MSKFKLDPLKIGGLLVAVCAYFIARESQKQDIEEAVEKKLDELNKNAN